VDGQQMIQVNNISISSKEKEYLGAFAALEFVTGHINKLECPLYLLFIIC